MLLSTEYVVCTCLGATVSNGLSVLTLAAVSDYFLRLLFISTFQEARLSFTQVLS